ncbi:TRAP transporter large permease [Salipiger mangrovisoli]|uniref:TRAP transporter large permease protein n=1 Tax=Salipiger mangrovisoli TaxID=2865933 RepID=A0ABR9X839_9RHOB|nr:TRAP transporter large permease subunit [Salipiger mangrovisoli]MBE9639622.1 TRAP transporter large permease subunit [Salipiger mangrovisoli]
MTVAFLIVLFFVLILIGAPIAVALGGSAVLASMVFAPIPDGIFGQKLFGNVNHYTLMAVPFFFLAAEFMETGGLVHRLIGVARVFVGHLRAGLGMTAVLTCILFAAISGSSPATVAAVGNIMFPALREEGYSDRYAIGALATAGAIGILLPPSIPLILYGFVTETPIPALFLAGIVPGLIYGALLLFTARFLARNEKVTVRPRATAAEARSTLTSAIPALMLPVFIVIGIYGLPAFDLGAFAYDGGAIFTPTEAAAVSAVLAILIGLLIYRELKLRDIPRVVIAVGPRVGMIFWITTNALIFGYFITKIGLPGQLAQAVLNANLSPIVFLICVNLLLLVVGFFLEAVPTILIFAPLLQPAAQSLGIDPVHFAIIMIVNIEMGMITPPVGMNLFVASGVSGMSVFEVFRATIPWMLATLVALMIVTFVPAVSLWLPGPTIH